VSRGRKIVLAVVISGVVVLFGILALTFIFSASEVVEWRPPTKAKIAIVEVEGEISYGGDASPSQIRKLLVHAEEDDAVKAVVLQINSGGGDAGASWELFNEVRKVAAKKPVVASIADVGASGAYLVASAADEILATPMSVVGGVGASFEFPFEVPANATKPAKEISSLSSGEFKDMFADKRLDERERAYIKERLKSVLDVFLRCVCEKRNLSEDVRQNLTHGGWFTGEEGFKMGLVDKIGDLDDAVSEAARIAGIDLNETNVVILRLEDGNVREIEYEVLC